MNEEFFQNIKSAHFIGIGGIGVSAIVRLFLLKGITVTGSDREASIVTKGLEEQGARIFIGHRKENIPEGVDIVVYSPAVLGTNPELSFAREKGVPTYSYPMILGIVSKGMRTIAVSGTHGKTTTTAMIAEVLINVKKSPTVIVGSLLKSGSNFVAGTSNLFVVEACEYRRSFLNLFPEVLVITNIDNDHLDYYKNIDDIISAFHELAIKVPKHGFVVANLRDENVRKALSGVTATIVDYSKIGNTDDFNLAVPGDHNIKNAQAVLAVAEILNIAEDEALAALRNFQGTWRRMEYKGELSNGAKVYDDYAHHPTEIRATLQGLRAKYPEKNIRVIFQPHLYSRMKLLLHDFARSFADANEVIVAPIYAAREQPDPEISSEILADAISLSLALESADSCFEHEKNKSGTLRGVRAIALFPTIEKHLRDTVAPNDIIITMGAGDIVKIGETLLA